MKEPLPEQFQICIKHLANGQSADSQVNVIRNILRILELILRKKCPYSELFWSIFSPNAGKYGPGKLRIRTLFTQCNLLKFA